MWHVLGVPAHPLFVHAVVVLVPLAALGATACVTSSAARARYGSLVAVVTVAAAALVPFTTASGEALRATVDRSRLVERHAAMGDGLLVWVVLLAVTFVASLLLPRVALGDRARRALRLGLTVLVVLAAVVALVQVVRIGDSGARATWAP
jgi:hypothetical protein